MTPVRADHRIDRRTNEANRYAGSSVTDTEHSVEPILARGGLRRLRQGDLGAERSIADPLLPWARFRDALDAEIRRSVLDDQTLVVAALTVRSFPGAEPVGQGGQLQRQVLSRIRGANDNIRVTQNGDDGLLILIPSIRRRPDGEQAVTRLREVLGDPVSIEGLDHHLNPRIGAAMLDLDSPSSELVVEGATLALGRCDQLHPAMMFHPYHRVRQERREQLRQDLRNAVLAGDIEAALQPAFDLETGALVAVEALARWDRPDRGPVPPLEFIPLAVELGVDHLLTAHVLNRAIDLLGTISVRPTTDFRPLTLWLNVTPTEVGHPEFTRLIDQVVDGHPAITVGIELSPSPAAEDRETHEILRTLAGAGARIAIGDFGIGNANLTVVPRLAFDAVKLDRALVRQIAGNHDAAALIESLAGLADRLRLETTAQGIETGDQLKVVAAAGCTIGQGYYFAAPTSNLDAIARWFRR